MCLTIWFKKNYIGCEYLPKWLYWPGCCPDRSSLIIRVYAVRIGSEPFACILTWSHLSVEWKHIVPHMVDRTHTHTHHLLWFCEFFWKVRIYSLCVYRIQKRLLLCGLWLRIEPYQSCRSVSGPVWSLAQRDWEPSWDLECPAWMTSP